MARRLTAEELRAVCDPGSLPFASTAELLPLDGMIGRERAVGATAFGIAMKRVGYNLFVLGPARTGKTSTMRRVLSRAAAAEPTPSDFCYVYNFADPYRPVALELPAGRGRELREEMERLAEECRSRLPRAFESEEFERQKAQILEERANARHLMLREDVVEAVGHGRFHVHAVGTVDEGMALLTGREAGARGEDGRFPPGSVNAAVEAALEANIARLKELGSSRP